MSIRALLMSAVAAVTFAATTSSVLADPFQVIATQTPSGVVAPASWGGVLVYDYAATAAPGVPGTGIPAASLNDPAGLAYYTANNELFVGNRHANSAPSSINRFLYPTGGPATANGNITGNGLFGVHQIAFSPTFELFAANVGNGISRFQMAGTVAIPTGVIVPNNIIRGVAVSPDGTRLYATTAASTIRQFSLPTGAELAPFNIPAAVNLHYLRFRGADELYAADISANVVFRLTVDALNNLSVDGSTASPSAIAVTFSPDLNEMFVSGHSTGVISQYLYNNVNDTWDPAGTINTGTSLGDIITVPPPAAIPEPATLTLAALGIIPLLTRRSSRR
jgi:hypothetical protein